MLRSGWHIRKTRSCIIEDHNITTVDGRLLDFIGKLKIVVDCLSTSREGTTCRGCGSQESTKADRGSLCPKSSRLAYLYGLPTVSKITQESVIYATDLVSYWFVQFPAC